MDTPTAMVLVAAISTIPACINIYVGRKGREQLEKKIVDTSGELHTLMNGKVAEMVALARSSNVAEGKAAGIQQERVEERQRQDAAPKSPVPVVVKNTKSKPAIVKQAK